jgi:hypothetical protein
VEDGIQGGVKFNHKVEYISHHSLMSTSWLNYFQGRGTRPCWLTPTELRDPVLIASGAMTRALTA